MWLKCLRGALHFEKKSEINVVSFPPLPLPPILISWATRTAPTLSPWLRRSLYWLNESAPKTGSQALWSNPIWFYPIASAGHRGINNKQLYHKCLITQHNLLMAPSCSSPIQSTANSVADWPSPPTPARTWGIFMHYETNRFKFLHKSHKADFSILTNWGKKKGPTSRVGWEWQRGLALRLQAGGKQAGAPVLQWGKGADVK